MESLSCLDGRVLRSQSGQNIYCRYWTPETSTPRALVFVSHGFGEHSGYYEKIAKALVDKEFFVFAHDHEGHGKSGGTRAMVSSFDVYVRDVWTHIDEVTSRIPDVPIFLVGHSMGGLISVYTGLVNSSRIKGVVLISAFLHIDTGNINCCTKFIGSIITTCCKSMEIGEGDHTLICRDENLLKQYSEDPLCWQGGLKAGQGKVLMEGVLGVWKDMARVTWPLLIMHGTADGITDVQGSQRLYAEAASLDKTLELFDGGYHTLHHEPDGMGERVVQKAVDWIVDRC